jgi:two-component system, chemotaxis family, chemotaxis protein CheY
MAQANCAVLVVEDDRFIRESISAALEVWGYAVTTAVDGAAALDLVTAAPPALVILDMRMPVLDGWGFARAVQEQGLPVRILAMSASGDVEQVAAEIGAAGWLGKPFSIQTLIAEVKRLCPP